MKSVGLEELQQLLELCHEATRYAWAHKEEIEARTHTFTLYGPPAYNIGACAPSIIITPSRARKLMKKTSRKDYLVYELDEHFRVIRVIQIVNHTVQSFFHLFEYKGVQFAYPYSGTFEHTKYRAKMIAMKYENDRPLYYATGYTNFLFVQFFEHPSAEKMEVSTYRLFAKAEYNSWGMPINWDAPIGAEDSPVQYHFHEEPTEYINFKSWFE